MGLFVRLLLLAGGIFASWFIATDAPQYPVIRVIFGIIILTAFVAVLAFRSELKDWLSAKDHE